MCIWGVSRAALAPQTEGVRGRFLITAYSDLLRHHLGWKPRSKKHLHFLNMLEF